MDALRTAFLHRAREQEKKCITPPQRITADAFFEALGALPPEDWQRRGHSESFKMSEYYTGQVTTIYSRIGNNFYTFRDMASLTHEQIIAKTQTL